MKVPPRLLHVVKSLAFEIHLLVSITSLKYLLTRGMAKTFIFFVLNGWKISGKCEEVQIVRHIGLVTKSSEDPVTKQDAKRGKFV